MKTKEKKRKVPQDSVKPCIHRHACKPGKKCPCKDYQDFDSMSLKEQSLWAWAMW